MTLEHLEPIWTPEPPKSACGLMPRRSRHHLVDGQKTKHSLAAVPQSCFSMQDPELYAKLEEPNDDENDMLDLAYGLTET